jgi:hypothetical protein
MAVIGRLIQANLCDYPKAKVGQRPRLHARHFGARRAALSPNIYVTGCRGSTKCSAGAGSRAILTIVRVVTTHTDGYNSGMTTEQFRAALNELPFRPFTIHMVDGRSFDVPHRDFVAQSPSGRTVIVFQRNESYNVLDLPLMSELEVQAAHGRPT